MSADEQPPPELVQVGVAGEEPIDVIALAQRLFAARGIATRRVEHDLHVDDSGLALQPRVLRGRAAGKGIRTVSVVRFADAGAFSPPLFEYQHGSGATLLQALERGFDEWAQLDYPAIADALRATPQQCNMIQTTFPARDGHAAVHRRVLFGPLAHLRAAGAPPAEPVADGRHAFCPCCFLTRSMDAFRRFVERRETFGVRFYVARGPTGALLADCRVNGMDYEAGKAALLADAAGWSGAGVETRKQYVVIRDDPWRERS